MIVGVIRGTIGVRIGVRVDGAGEVENGAGGDVSTGESVVGGSAMISTTGKGATNQSATVVNNPKIPANDCCLPCIDKV